MVVAVANRNWEEIFTSWSARTKTENDKSQNAETAVRKAIAASGALSNKTVEVFVQGSYRNRTNARFDSDVDVCVRLMDVFFSDLTDGVTQAEANISDAASGPGSSRTRWRPHFGRTSALGRSPVGARRSTSREHIPHRCRRGCYL